MTALLTLTLIWAAAVVLALVVALSTTAMKLRQARSNLAGIADDLERIAAQAEPLDGKLTSIGSEVEQIVGALARVDDAMTAVTEVIAGLQVAGRR